MGNHRQHGKEYRETTAKSNLHSSLDGSSKVQFISFCISIMFCAILILWWKEENSIDAMRLMRCIYIHHTWWTEVGN